MASKYHVTFRDKDEKRRTIVARVSIFADFTDAIKEVLKRFHLPLRTYVYNVRQGMTTYIWHDSAFDAFTAEERAKYPY